MANQPQTDSRDVPVSSCNPSSLEDYETALRQFQSYFGDPTETLTGTLERDPGFVIGHLFMANAMLLMSERQYQEAASEHIVHAESLADRANDRERLHMQASRRLLESDWLGAGRMLDAILVGQPRDAMALQTGHLLDFYTGNAVNLRDRIGRVLAHWDHDTPGYSYVLGMQAFGFEECNQFDRAEDTARQALAIEPRDGWSVHALAHVMEMQNRYEEGQQFLTGSAGDWAPDNGFAFHNWWHLALFHVEQEDFQGALGLYDQQILPGDCDVSLQMLDASALLWRLHLQDVDCGDRWAGLADLWARKVETENGFYAFNDLHAVVAMVGAGRFDEARHVLLALYAAADTNPSLTAMMAREVGIPAGEGMLAFAEARYAEAVEALLKIRTSAIRFGGSNAQRDILTQTLIESAIRDGQTALATSLLNERAVHKPASPLTRRFRSKLH